jgi:hypothetical protein
MEAACVRIIFSDASYGRWLDKTWKYFLSNLALPADFIVLTRKWDKPYKHAKRFLKKFRNIPYNIKHVIYNRKTTHAGIGDQSFPWAYKLIDENSGCGEGERK